MKKIILFFLLFFAYNLSFSQSETEEKTDSVLLKSKKIEFFDIDIFKPTNSHKDFFKNLSKQENTTSKMPVFTAKGNYKLKVFVVDTIKNYTLKIVKPK
jgi:hypothetical protein